MKYALALLDPASQPAFAYLKTAGLIDGPFGNRPLAWDAANSSKFIVLMTDGRTGTQFRPTDEFELENTDTALTDRPSDDSTTFSSATSNRDMFLAQCDLAKANGVIVYTVAVDMSSYAAQEIEDCASSPAHFFEVSSNQMVDTFVSIAASIQSLRLIQ